MSFMRAVGKGVWRSGAVAMALVGSLSATAWAQDPAAPADPNPGNITLTATMDFSNAYVFRGIRQDDTKVIMWPAFDLGIALYSGKGGLKSAGVNFGSWNSLHAGDAGLDSATSKLGCACGKVWYESDFYATLGLGFGGGVSLSTTYTAYTSPNAGFSNVKEIMFKLAVDDSATLKKAALHPYGIVALEMNTAPGVGQADGGSKAGRYLELGMAPGWSVSAVSLAFPVKVGISLADYYEAPIGAKGALVDSRFGYFSVSGTVTAPIKPVPAGFGSWNVHAGVEVQALGDSTKFFNNGDSKKVIVSGGIGLTY